jgi:hypothetical protein
LSNYSPVCSGNGSVSASTENAEGVVELQPSGWSVATTLGHT